MLDLALRGIETTTYRLRRSAQVCLPGLTLPYGVLKLMKATNQRRPWLCPLDLALRDIETNAGLLRSFRFTIMLDLALRGIETCSLRTTRPSSHSLDLALRGIETNFLA